MNLYLANDLNKRYSDIVTDYLSKGFVFSCGTMAGHQGELVKQHLISPDKKYLINIIMDRKSDWKHGADIVTISTRRYEYNDIKRELQGLCTMNTIWNDKGKEIANEKYYELSRYQGKAFTDADGFESVRQKKSERYRNYDSYISERKELDNRYKHIAYTWLKKQPKCKSVRPTDIDKIERTTDREGKVAYYVYAKNKCYKMK